MQAFNVFSAFLRFHYRMAVASPGSIFEHNFNQRIPRIDINKTFCSRKVCLIELAKIQLQSLQLSSLHNISTTVERRPNSCLHHMY